MYEGLYLLPRLLFLHLLVIILQVLVLDHAAHFFGPLSSWSEVPSPEEAEESLLRSSLSELNALKSSPLWKESFTSPFFDSCNLFPVNESFLCTRKLRRIPRLVFLHPRNR